MISIDDLAKLKQLPSVQLTPAQNLKHIFKYETRGLFVDFLLFCIILCVVPEGDGTGIEVFMALIVLVLYGSVLMIFSLCLQKRIKQYFSSVEHNIQSGSFKYIDSVWPISIVVKLLFTMAITIWIVEVR